MQSLQIDFIDLFGIEKYRQILFQFLNVMSFREIEIESKYYLIRLELELWIIWNCV